jgi:hypothetical protein
MFPSRDDAPAGALADAIVRDFGGLEQLKVGSPKPVNSGLAPDGFGLRERSSLAASYR